MKNQRRVKRHYRQQLVAPVTEVFPLLCPVKEAQWLDGFEYQMVYSESGVAEPGCVFTTGHPGEPDTVWTIVRHDPDEGVVGFLRVTPGWLVTELQVRLADIPGNRCTADITYTYTVLGPQGDAALDGRHSEEGFVQMARHWERSLNHYLTTGQMLAPTS